MTRAPAPLAPPRPVPPPGAEGRSADVTLLVDLDASGAVTRTEVVGPAGDADSAGFEAAARAAVAAMRFSPAEVDGRPSPIRFRYVIRFRPGNGSADAGDGAAAPPSDAGADVARAAAGPPDAAAPDLASPPPRDQLVLRGRARERGTRAPITGAEVTVLAKDAAGAAIGSARVVGETDAAGRFTVRVPGALAAHGLRITVADPAHEPCVRELSAGELDRPSDPESPLVRAEWSCLASRRQGPGYETVVTAAPANPEVPRHGLTREEARSVPGTMGDPLRAVQSLPGVARAPFGTGMLVVRGASPNDSGVFLDGLQVPLLYHFLIGPSVLPAPLVGQIDFYPGGFGARLGRLSAGAVDVTTRAAPLDHSEGNFEMSALDASLLVSTPVAPDTTITVGARRSVIDFILPKLVPEKPGTTFATAVPNYWDYQARVQHRLPRGDRLSLFAFGSSDRLDVVSADPNRRLELGNHISFHRVQLSWTTEFAGFTSKFEPAYGRGQVSFVAGADNGYISYERFYLRHELSRDIARRLGLSLGLDAVFSTDEGSFDIVFPREGRTFGATRPERNLVARSYVDIVPAAWMEARWKVTDWLRVVPGLRFDPYFIVESERYTADPRLGVHVALSERLTMRAGAGIFHQLPEPRYLDFELGNPKLRMIRAEQYFLGADHQLTDVLSASATVYAVWRRYIPVPSAERYASTGRARARGIEVMLRRRLHRGFYGWLSYSLSRAEQNADFAEEIETGLASPRGAPQDEGARPAYRPSTFNQTHNLIAVASQRLGAWELGARYRLVSGRPTTPIASAFVDLDFGGFTPERGAPFSTERPLFSQLDVRVERTFTFDLFELGVFVDVQNVLNSENPEEIVWDYRYRHSDAVRGLPILPILGVRGSF